jgi:hypothetical protein
MFCPVAAPEGVARVTEEDLTEEEYGVDRHSGILATGARPVRSR